MRGNLLKFNGNISIEHSYVGFFFTHLYPSFFDNIHFHLIWSLFSTLKPLHPNYLPPTRRHILRKQQQWNFCRKYVHWRNHTRIKTTMTYFRKLCWNQSPHLNTPSMIRNILTICHRITSTWNWTRANLTRTLISLIISTGIIVIIKGRSAPRDILKRTRRNWRRGKQVSAGEA